MISKFNIEIASYPSLRLLGQVKKLSILRPNLKRPARLSDEHRGFLPPCYAELWSGQPRRHGRFQVSTCLKECTVCAEYRVKVSLDEIHFALRLIIITLPPPKLICCV